LADPFIGEIRTFGFNFAPIGWLPCNGQTLAIQQYQPLFALLGTQFGGNGSTNFALPNLQGRFVLGTSSNHPIGESAGSETVTLTVNQLPAHNHAVTLTGLTATLNGSESPADQNTPTGNALAAPDSAIYAGAPPNKALASGSVAVSGNPTCALTGNNLPIPTMPPFVSVNYCIAYQGIFPSRP
jgi:microcystin-dependent protein